MLHHPDNSFTKSEYSNTSQSFIQSISLDFYRDNPSTLFCSFYPFYIVNTVFRQLESYSKRESINPNNQEDMNKFFDLLRKHDIAIGSEPFIRYENKTIKENYKEIISQKKTLFT